MKLLRLTLVAIVALGLFCNLALAKGWDWSTWDNKRAQAQEQTETKAEPKARTLGERLNKSKKGVTLNALEPKAAVPAPAPKTEPEPVPEPAPEPQQKTVAPKQLVAPAPVPPPPAPPMAPKKAEPAEQPEPETTVPAARTQTAEPLPITPYAAPAPARVKKAEVAPPPAPEPAPAPAPEPAPEPEPVPEYKPAIRAVSKQPKAQSKPDAAEAAKSESTATMLAPRNDVARTQNAVLASPEVEHFLTVAMYDHDEQRFHREQNLAGDPAPRVLTRWEADVRVRVMGDASTTSQNTILNAVRRIDRALPLNGGVRAKVVDADANLTLYIFPKAPSADIKAYSTLRHEGARITGGEVVLYQDMINEGVVLRELLRVLGFQGDDEISGTLMQPDTPGAAGTLTELDRRALSILYGPRVKTGMTMDQVRAAMR